MSTPTITIDGIQIARNIWEKQTKLNQFVNDSKVDFAIKCLINCVSEKTIVSEMMNLFHLADDKGNRDVCKHKLELARCLVLDGTFK